MSFKDVKIGRSGDVSDAPTLTINVSGRQVFQGMLENYHGENLAWPVRPMICLLVLRKVMLF
jgi:hypothetical protein